MKLFERLAAALLMICMVISLLPSIALPASAAEDTTVTGTFTEVTSLADVTSGQYVIVGKQKNQSFGKLAYGTISDGRLPYTSEYSTAPVTVENPDVSAVWELTVTGTTVQIKSKEAEKYLNFNDSTDNAGRLSFGNTSSEYTIAYQETNSSFSLWAMQNNGKDMYLGVNKSSDYWRAYTSATLTDNGGLHLYKLTETETDAQDYAVTFNVNGEVTTASTTNGFVSKPDDPAIAGYDFCGWSETPLAERSQTAPMLFNFNKRPGNNGTY